MSTKHLPVLAFAALLAVVPHLRAQGGSDAGVPVTIENFARAESDRYFTGIVKRVGLGKFYHWREPVLVEGQTVIRPNRDTLYSTAVFDLDAGPVIVSLPDASGRYMALSAKDEDHYVIGVYYRAASYTFTKKDVGTRYLMLSVRTLIDPGKSGDLQQARALQDAIQVSHPNGPG